MSTKKQTYETSLQELQTIVSELQEGKVNMDDLTAKIRRASALVSYCQEKLRGLEKEIESQFNEPS